MSRNLPSEAQPGKEPIARKLPDSIFSMDALRKLCSKYPAGKLLIDALEIEEGLNPGVCDRISGPLSAVVEAASGNEPGWIITEAPNVASSLDTLIFLHFNCRLCYCSGLLIHRVKVLHSPGSVCCVWATSVDLSCLQVNFCDWYGVWMVEALGKVAESLMNASNEAPEEEALSTFLDISCVVPR